MGLLPGALMIAFAFGLKADPQSASAFAGRPTEPTLEKAADWNASQRREADVRAATEKSLQSNRADQLAD